MSFHLINKEQSMEYRELKNILAIIDNHLSYATKKVTFDESHATIYVTEDGWPANLSYDACHFLDNRGWSFNGDIDAWEVSI